MKQLLRYALLMVGMLLLSASVLAQQGNNGNAGNGAIFIENGFTGVSIGIPDVVACFSTLQPGDDIQEWIRINPDGTQTVHWVDRAATITFFDGVFLDDGSPELWIGSGRTTLNTTLEEPAFNWRATGTVTNQSTGETRDVVCQVLQDANGEIRKFDLSFKGQ